MTSDADAWQASLLDSGAVLLGRILVVRGGSVLRSFVVGALGGWRLGLSVWIFWLGQRLGLHPPGSLLHSTSWCTFMATVAIGGWLAAGVEGLFPVAVPRFGRCPRRLESGH